MGCHLRVEDSGLSSKGHESDDMCIPSGVIKGSLLGPLLFIIYINDLPTSINHSTVFLYADDSKFCRVIKSESDCRLLQSDILVDGQCKTWNHVNLNLNKCTVVSFSNKRDTINFNYKFH